LRLGADLETVVLDWRAQQAIDAEHSATRQAACEAAGLPDIDYRSLPDHEYRAYQRKRSAVMSAACPYDADTNEAGQSIAWNEIHDRMFSLIDEILPRKAKTIAGIAVQAQAMVMDNTEWWDNGLLDENDDETPEGRGRLFLESLCSFLGITPRPKMIAGEAVHP
jgi:hypothetical protein